MTSPEKVKSAEAQAILICRGELAQFVCPFCGQLSRMENQILCCELAARVILEVSKYLAFKRGVEMVERVMDRFNSAKPVSPMIQ
jgi:hypothetical protein